MYKSENAISFIVNTTNLRPKGIKDTFIASSHELSALAANHGLVTVESFEFSFHLVPWKMSGLRLKLTLQAAIVQACVVSLADVKSQIDEEIELFFVVDGDNVYKPFMQEETRELFLDIEADDIPEIYDGNSLDVGKVAEEFFELSIPIYPKAAGAKLPASSACSELAGDIIIEDKAHTNPFSVLAKLKNDLLD